MEIKQAVKQFRNYEKLGWSKSEIPNSMALIMAIEALKKQMPIPPVYEVREKYKQLGKCYYCNCGVMLLGYEHGGSNYCGNCGQRLNE